MSLQKQLTNKLPPITPDFRVLQTLPKLYVFNYGLRQILISNTFLIPSSFSLIFSSGPTSQIRFSTLKVSSHISEALGVNEADAIKKAADGHGDKPVACQSNFDGPTVHPLESNGKNQRGTPENPRKPMFPFGISKARRYTPFFDVPCCGFDSKIGGLSLRRWIRAYGTQNPKLWVFLSHEARWMHVWWYRFIVWFQ